VREHRTLVTVTQTVVQKLPSDANGNANSARYSTAAVNQFTNAKTSDNAKSSKEKAD
jgi:hypothetical protein